MSNWTNATKIVFVSMYRETRALYSYRQKCSNITIIYLGLEDDDEDDEDLELGEDGDKVSNFKTLSLSLSIVLHQFVKFVKNVHVDS